MSPGPNPGAVLNARQIPAALLALTLAVLPLAASIPARSQPAPAEPAALYADDTADLRELADLARADRSHRTAVEQLATKPVVVVPLKVVKAVAKAPITQAPPQRTEGYAGPKATGNLATAVSFALAQVGKPYRYGAAGPSTWDCSGLVQQAWKRIGITLPHSAAGIGTRGTYVPRAAWTPGTILAYGGPVAIYLGGGRMVHAANPRKGVVVSAVYGNPSGRRIG